MPQLNPEFFISQLFWLILTFTFLFIFLWRISLPRISSVLEKRETKINDDVAVAKQLQAEAEEIQKKIDELQSIQKNTSNIWIVLHENLPLPCKTYVINQNKNLFSDLFIDAKHFVTSKNLDKLRILKT